VISLAYPELHFFSGEAIFSDFLRPVFSAIRVHHILDMHPKFALRPHHVRKYGTIQSPTAEIRRRKKEEEEEKEEETGQKYNVRIYYAGLP